MFLFFALLSSSHSCETIRELIHDPLNMNENSNKIITKSHVLWQCLCCSLRSVVLISEMSRGNESLVVGSRSRFSAYRGLHYSDTDCIRYFFRVQVWIREWPTLVPLGYDVTHFQ